MSSEQDLQLIEKESNELAIKANGFTIATNDQYVAAMNFAKLIKESIKKVEAAFDPIIKQAHATWKSAIVQKDSYVAPREAALNILDGKGRVFRIEQEKIRQAEEIKARELAKKEAEKLAARAAKAAEKGQTEKAEALQQQAQEVAAITPVVAPKVSKVEGIVVRKIWKFQITHPELVPREFLTPDLVKLGGEARNMKGTRPVAGVRFYSEDSNL